MNGLVTSVNLTLPAWVEDAAYGEGLYRTDDAKMRLAVELARRNVEARTGGPFGAAIFEAATGELISAGVNRVVPLNNSTAHAEMMAFMLAQVRLGKFRLDGGVHAFVLATSAQPCAMCYGGVVWAGVRRMIVAARKEDVETHTHFDEGPMPEDWAAGLRARGIEVTLDVLRADAVEVLKEYTRLGGADY
ncbi:MAG: nucleoside deaminase [Opitutales bacterium]|nr:nucleoside deaminase [Opitutales bacterium]